MKNEKTKIEKTDEKLEITRAHCPDETLQVIDDVMNWLMKTVPSSYTIEVTFRNDHPEMVTVPMSKTFRGVTEILEIGREKNVLVEKPQKLKNVEFADVREVINGAFAGAFNVGFQGTEPPALIITENKKVCDKMRTDDQFWRMKMMDMIHYREAPGRKQMELERA